MEKQTTLLILAAGMGSRYGGLKQMDGIGPHGETIIDYSVYDAVASGFSKVVFVIREDFAADFKAKVSNKFKDVVEVVHVYQSLDTGFEELPCPEDRSKPWGTGHAILAAKEVIDEPFAVINADDFYGRDSFTQAHLFLSGLEHGVLGGMVGYSLENTLSDNGHVNRGICQVDDNYFLEQVVEREKIERKNSDVVYQDSEGGENKLSEKSIVSMNYWLFHPEVFEDLEAAFESFLKTHRLTPKSEFYIPFFVDEKIKTKELQVLVLISEDSWHGVTYQADRNKVSSAMKNLHDENKYPQQLFEK